MALTNVVTTINLDVYDHDTTPSTVKAIALDSKTRYVGAALFLQGNPYGIPQTASVTLTVLRPDNTGVQVTGSTYSYDADGTTMYGAYAELTQLALAVKGTCAAQFKITDGEQILRTEIFHVNNGQALDADIEEWAGDLDGHNLDEMAESIETLETNVGQIQEDLSTVKEGLTHKVASTTIFCDDIEDGWYSNNNGQKMPNTSSSHYKRSKNLIPVEEGALYAADIITMCTCFDKDGTFIKKITIYTETDKFVRQTIPTGTTHVGLTATNAPSFTLTKVDASGVTGIEYPYTSKGCVHVESCWCNGNGGVYSTNNFDMLVIPVKEGERWYVSNQADYNLICLDETGTKLTATYETRSPIGKIVTIPTGGKIMYANLYRARTKGVNSEMSDYVARVDGKKILAVGDSLTWLDGRSGSYGGMSYFSGWQRQLRLAGHDVISAGFSGYPYATGLDIVDGVDYSIYKEIVTKAYDVSGYDMVILFGGTNDVLYNGALGDRPTDYSNRTFDASKFNGALGAIISYIRTNNTEAKIILASFPKSEAVSRVYKNARARVDEIEYNANFWSCKYVNVWGDMNVQPTYDGFDQFFYDATHANFFGMERIGKIMLSAVENIFGNSGSSLTGTDATLSVTNKPADAKATGDAIRDTYITNTAAGAVAHFEDGADDVLMKSVKVAIAPVQSGTGNPSPSNVRPISGWDSIRVTKAGKNLLEPWIASQVKNGVTYTTSSDGTIVTSGQATANSQILSGRFLLPAGDYVLSGCPSGGSGETYFLRALLYNGNTLVRILNSDYGTGAIFTISEDEVNCELIVFSAIQNGNTVNSTWKPMIEVGTSATAYEPYTANTYNISLASAGTVYGGTLDVLTGELTVTSELIPLRSVSGTAASNNVRRFYTGISYEGRSLLICDTLKLGGHTELNTASVNNEGRILITPDWAQSIDTVDGFASALSNHPTNFLMTLATPITYHLTPSEIKSLLGINNVWSDAGDVEVEYRADTKLYINKLTKSDTDMIADANITSGKYFMVGNNLYKATANIANGAQIIVGTNCISKSLSEALNEINA